VLGPPWAHHSPTLRPSSRADVSNSDLDRPRGDVPRYSGPAMNGLLLLSVVLAAPDAGVSARALSPDAGGSARTTAPAAVRAPDAGAQVRAPDAGSPRADARPTGDGGPSPRDGGGRSTSVDGAPQPATSVAVQEPAAPDAGNGRKKKARADRTDGSDPAMDALLEQSRAQTEALQQMSAQQRAYEEARVSEQQARTQRSAQVDGARYSIDSAVQSLQTTGDWSAQSLESTRTSLQQTAAAASAANSPAEASRAAEAARLVQAAQTALAQKNAQLAQYYLMQANQLLGGGGGGQNVRY